MHLFHGKKILFPSPQDVVEDRCLHMMPYDDKYFSGVFEPGSLVPVPAKAKNVMGRMNKIGTDNRHMPSFLKKIAKPPPLTPLRKQVKEKAVELHKAALVAKQQEQQNGSKNAGKNAGAESSSFFITELVNAKEQKGKVTLKPIPETKELPATAASTSKLNVSTSTSREQTQSRLDTAISGRKTADTKSEVSGQTSSSKQLGDSEAHKNDWDDHLMSRLSKLTANWIVHEKLTEPDTQKEKLTARLESWYGKPTHTDLVREQASDEEEDEEEKKKEQKPKRKWKKKEAS